MAVFHWSGNIPVEIKQLKMSSSTSQISVAESFNVRAQMPSVPVLAVFDKLAMAIRTSLPRISGRVKLLTFSESVTLGVSCRSRPVNLSVILKIELQKRALILFAERNANDLFESGQEWWMKLLIFPKPIDALICFQKNLQPDRAPLTKKASLR